LEDIEAIEEFMRSLEKDRSIGTQMDTEDSKDGVALVKDADQPIVISSDSETASQKFRREVEEADAEIEARGLRSDGEFDDEEDESDDAGGVVPGVPTRLKEGGLNRGSGELQEGKSGLTGWLTERPTKATRKSEAAWRKLLQETQRRMDLDKNPPPPRPRAETWKPCESIAELAGAQRERERDLLAEEEEEEEEENEEEMTLAAFLATAEAAQAAEWDGMEYEEEEAVEEEEEEEVDEEDEVALATFFAAARAAKEAQEEEEKKAKEERTKRHARWGPY
jgi:hypothetical protein